MMRRSRHGVKINSLLDTIQRYIVNPRIARYVIRKLQRRQTSNLNLHEFGVSRDRERLLNPGPSRCSADLVRNDIQLFRQAIAKNMEPDALIRGDTVRLYVSQKTVLPGIRICALSYMVVSQILVTGKMQFER